MSDLLTVRQFAEKHPAFSQSALRYMRFDQDKNGFKDAFLNVGRRVLIDEARFFEIVRQQNAKAA